MDEWKFEAAFRSLQAARNPNNNKDTTSNQHQTATMYNKSTQSTIL